MNSDEGAEQAIPAKARDVLCAARRVFLRHGFSGATTDMIQQEAGVSKSTVYAHYPSKEALFLAVIDLECAAHMAQIQRISESQCDLREKLRGMAEGYLKIILSGHGRALFRAVVAECNRFPQIGARFNAAGPRQFHAALRRTLDEADRADDLRIGRGGLDTAAALFAGMLRGNLQIGGLLVEDGGASPGAPEGWVDSVLEMFFAAYGPRR